METYYPHLPRPTGLQRFASAVSGVFSPLLMPTYGVMLAVSLSFLCYSTFKARAVVTLATFLATCIIPVIAIYGFTRAGIIKDPRLLDRRERTGPYLVATLCYIGTALYYHWVNAPVWLSMFTLGGAMALGVLTLINSRWKISGHATAQGAIVAMLFFLMVSGNSVGNIQWEFILVVLLAGLVCSCRLILQVHTLGQVAAGFANGFVWVFLFAWLFHENPLPPM